MTAVGEEDPSVSKLVGMSEEGTSSLIPMETMPPTQASSTQQNGYSIPLGARVQGGGGYEDEEEESEDDGSEEESYVLCSCVCVVPLC